MASDTPDLEQFRPLARNQRVVAVSRTLLIDNDECVNKAMAVIRAVGLAEELEG